MYTHHHETIVTIAAPAASVFAFIDDHHKLAAHMNRRSWRMGGGRMYVETDVQGGRTVGSRIRMAGVVFGLRLALEEAVIERVPPRRKVWETVGAPHLFVIGPYRLGAEVAEAQAGCRLKVFIDYDLPAARWQRWLGQLFAPVYARWCTEQMAHDARTAVSARNSGGR